MSCQLDVNKSPKLLGAPANNDQVMIIKADGTTPLLINFNTFMASMLPPRDMYLIVGADQNAPTDNSNSWTLSKFVGYYVDITVNEVPMFQVLNNAIPPDGVYYQKPLSADTLVTNGFRFYNNDKIHLRFYLGSEDVASRYIASEADPNVSIQDETGTQNINTD